MRTTFEIRLAQDQIILTAENFSKCADTKKVIKVHFFGKYAQLLATFFEKTAKNKVKKPGFFEKYPGGFLKN